jgi:hypothetical protein
VPTVAPSYDTNGVLTQGWTTTPPNLNKDTPEIYISIRTKASGEENYGSFSIPSLWAKLGEDGTSVNIKGEKSSPADLANVQNPEIGDGYLIQGDLWLYTGDGTSFADAPGWVNAGNIKGPQGAPGSTSYLHIKYSNDNGQTFTANNGEDPGDYIGTCVNFSAADPTEVSAYKWA